MAGRVRVRGRCKYVHVSSVAASMRLTPRTRTHPAFDRFPRSVVDPHHAWMLFEFNSKYSICLENHPRMAWIYQT
ncbi:hypothetical protein DL544_03645 [Stenotrophomonas sp. pho]|nr:hypothetical protein DL544_03645 [Stenotrophomonas sp. pho]